MTARSDADLATRARVDRADYPSQAAHRVARATAWVRLMREGFTMTAIALAADLSRERVRQVVRREGFTEQRTPAPVDPRRVVAALRKQECRDVKGLARLSGCGEPEARRVLRAQGLEAEAKRLFERRSRTLRVRDAGYDRDTILRRMQEFNARHGRPPGITDALAHLLPFSKTTVLRRFGKWNKAIVAAGLDPWGVKPKSRRVRQTSK